MNFLMGFAFGGRNLVGYAWVAENMRASDMPLATTVIFTVDAANLFIASLYFRYASRDW